MTFEVTLAIRSDHPSLPGHFPDTTLVPGVVILDEILAALGEWRQGCQLTGIRTVKFLVPPQPEQPFAICSSTEDDATEEVHFSRQVGDRLIVEGRPELILQTK